MTQTAWRPPMPDDLIWQIKAAWNQAETDDRVATLKGAYAAGWSLQEIGEVVGVTREAIRLWIQQPCDVASIPAFEPKPLKRRPFREVRAHPGASVPDEAIQALRDTHALATRTNGSTPLDHPYRKAGAEFCDLVEALVDKYGVSYYWLSQQLGLDPHTVWSFLARRGRGGLKNSPSQPSYKHEHRIPTPPRTRTGSKAPRSPIYIEYAEKLRANPGVWMPWPKNISPKYAPSIPHGVRNGRFPALYPDFNARPSHDENLVEACYIGEAS